MIHSLAVLDVGVPIANGVSLALSGLLLTALMQIVRNGNRREREHERQQRIRDLTHARIVDGFEYRLEAQELETVHCQQGFLSIVSTCARSGMEVDESLFRPAPKPARRDPRLDPPPSELLELLDTAKEVKR